MNRNLLLSVCLSVAVFSGLSVSGAADPYRSVGESGSNARSLPPRTLLGIPVPQQWQRSQFAGANAGLPAINPQMAPWGRGTNCPGGQCSPRDCANGTCAGPQASAGRCPSGNCPTGMSQVRCVNGQCFRAPTARALPAAGNCANGQCLPKAPGRPVVRNQENDWTPRATKVSEPADPFGERDSGRLSDAALRLVRPAVEPLRETFGSGYDSRDLDLRSNYFRGQSRLNEEPQGRRPVTAPEPRSRVRGSSIETIPVRRTIDAPRNSQADTARI